MKASVNCTLIFVAIFLAGCATTADNPSPGSIFGSADRRTTAAYLTDSAISLRIHTKFRERSIIDVESDSVQITPFNRIVLLTGSVSSEAKRKEIIESARHIDNVRAVIAELRVAPNRSKAEKAQDSELVSSVLAAIERSSGFSRSLIKVEAYQRAIFLMGIVTEREAQLITDTASRVPGVVRVTRAFEILSERELSTITGKKEQPDAPYFPGGTRFA